MLSNEAAEAINQLNELRAGGVPLPRVKMPPHYTRLVGEEVNLIGEGGPLYSVVYPKSDRFETFARDEVVNLVEDFANMPEGLERVIVHRYPHKLLYFPTDTCIGHSQYCFRPDVTGPDARHKNLNRNLSPEVVARAAEYLRCHPEVREVIFSGGDPLACRPKDLERATKCFLSVPSVRWLRLHTKAPIFNPKLVTDRFIDMCARYRIRVVLHATHPYELTSELAKRLKGLRAHNVPIYNQFPLLRGINDHAAVIMEPAYACADLGMRMLSMFVADPIRYGATYKLRLSRVYEIAGEVFRKGASWISNFRVCRYTPIGKVKREHIVSHDPDRDVYAFERDRRQVRYRDIPAEMDARTPLRQLLYRGAASIDLPASKDNATCVCQSGTTHAGG